MTPLIRLAVVAVPPLAFLISMTHIVAAHNSPGDGFTAGIISALGLTLQYVAFGFRRARLLYRELRFERIVPIGLLLALFATVLPVAFGQPVLGTVEWHLTIPLVGEVTLTRAMLFDLGIYLVVLGGTMTAIDTLGETAS